MSANVGFGDSDWQAIVATMFEADSPVGKAVLDKDLRYVLINRALANFNGATIEQHLGRTVQEMLPLAYPTVEPLLRGVLEQGQSHEFRISVEMPNAPGRLSEWEASYIPVRRSDGSVGGVYVQAVNLTAKLLAERALRDSEKQVRRVLDSLFAFVGVLAPDGTLLEANRAPLEAAGIEASDVLGRFFWDTFWWSHDPAVQAWSRNACMKAAAGENFRGDVQVRMIGNSRMMLDFMIVPMRDDEGRITNLVASAIDISDRVAYQQRIESALKERTVLLQEVHHRVKNNLQIIASLLRLQARTAGPEAAGALQDSQNRVMAMALTHQLLYERNDFSSLELGPYLRRLVTSLREMHGDLLRRVQLEVEAADAGMAINLQQAVPVALVVNELLTNALKHAFPTESHGKVKLQASRLGAFLQVQVSDSGTGLPPGVDVRDAKGLGFNLIKILSEQIHADVEWPRAGGPATFKLRIPAREEQSP